MSSFLAIVNNQVSVSFHKLFDVFPHVKRWYEAIEARPAVQKGLAVLEEHKVDAKQLDKDAFSMLFGDKQYAQR